MPRPLRMRLLVALGALVLATLANALPALGADTLTPATVTLTMSAGSSTDVKKTYHLDALPGAADIIIAIDTTGSMGAAIAQAKAQATALCNDVQAAIPGARFAVMDFKDVPDRPATQGVLILTPAFTSSCAAVQAAVNTMSAGGGFDIPEAYNWVFNKAYNDLTHPDAAAVALDATRNPAAVQFLVVLGDAPPHNSPAPTVAPACGNTPPADAGVDSTREIAGLNAKDITLLMINYGNQLSCYSQLAGATGGTAVNAGGDLSNDIISQIKAAAAHIGEAHLAVTGPCTLVTAGGSVSFSPTSYTNVTAPKDLAFTETITAPTTAGTYTCTVQGYADGVARGNPEEITVTVVAGAPVKVVLSPMAATNVVGAKHCVDATVTDAFNNPVEGANVVFSVPTSPATHASPSGGLRVTNSSGVATFCYTASLPGVDEIDAAVDSNANGTYDVSDHPQAPPASKVWTLPTSTSFCEVKITYGGWIFANNSDRANFGGNAQVDNSGNPKGQEEYQDQGPVQPMNVHSTKVTATTCDDARQHATIFGEATINGSGTWIFRIDVSDMGEPGTNDTYGILLSNGYDSGQKTLEGGNVQIH